MNAEELAFFNQQLAGMLKHGLPLEGSIRQLCESMRRGQLRTELQKLADDLSSGTPLKDAVQARNLPAVYVQLLQVGAQSGDLPAVLTLVADYYQRAQLVWTRLKGLMVYPAIVLFFSLLLSLLFSLILSKLSREIWVMDDFIFDRPPPMSVTVFFFLKFWGPPFLIGLALAALLLTSLLPKARAWVRWRLPGYHETSLSQVASLMAILLRSGCTMDQALQLAIVSEARSPAAGELSNWRRRLSEGHAKFADFAIPGKIFPPMFLWFVNNGGEDPALGFQRAADVYQARAQYRADMLLYGVMPFSVLVLGILIFDQFYTMALAFIRFMTEMIRALTYY